MRLLICVYACALSLLGSGGFARVIGAELGGSAARPAGSFSNAWAEGDLAIKRFQVPAGFKMELFAAEPQLANPVAFCIDERGRIYVAETYRYRTSALDIREYMNWYNDDLAARTVNDRVAVIKKHLDADSGKLAVESEQIRLIEDRDGDGKADFSTIFAGGFNGLLDGIASGVLAYHGSVYFANIPSLTLLRDENGDGIADQRKTISTGYGVHFSLTGHDLHGLRIGPDGMLYFSVGDRGSAVKSAEGQTYSYPDEGVVYRCQLDGSGLEVFATGLRNPQELAFDEYGNLWTGDNNCDHGDSARLVYVVEGGDSGWRIGYQFSETTPAGVWNSEKLWHLRWPGQAAYLLPPIAHIANGPSGLAYYPGTGLPESYRGHFFLCDFRGQAIGSGIHSFAVRPQGAGFEITGTNHFLWDALMTDVDFGPDGRMYMTDWVHGWPQSGRGRIYRLSHPEAMNSPVVSETRDLLRAGLAQRSNAGLAALLEHPDMRVRMESQFTLVSKGSEAVEIFRHAAVDSKNQLARLHAIWGLTQIGKKRSGALDGILHLAADSDPEVRAQTAKAIGECRAAKARDALIKLLTDDSPRVRFHAAMSLAKIPSPAVFGPIVSMARANEDRDIYLRHAVVMALAALRDESRISTLASDRSAAVRMAGLLALRRLGSSEIKAFLKDSDPLLAVEAARAINDVPISNAFPQLAELAWKPNDSEPLLRRAINAGFRLGRPSDARRLASFASDARAPAKVRAEAVGMLAQWETPSSRDKVVGLWRPLSSRDPQPAVAALTPVIGRLLQTPAPDVQIAAAKAVGALGLKTAGKMLAEVVKNTQLTPGVRVESLRTLASLKDAALADSITFSQTDFSEALRREANRLQAQTKPAAALESLITVLDHGSVFDRQGAFAALATIEGSLADEVLLQWLDKATTGDIPKEIELDLFEAAEQRTDARIKKSLDEIAVAGKSEDPLARYRVCLEGGDTAAGNKIFFERAEVACVRCHKIKGEGGDVGPDLTSVGTKQTREYILESILLPSAKIAPGFESAVVRLKSGPAYAGVVKHEDDQTLQLMSPEDGLVKVPKNEILTREKGLSGMPEGMGNLLNRQELRNLIEYLVRPK